MRKLIAIAICIILLAGCQPEGKPNEDEGIVIQTENSETTAVTELLKTALLEKLTVFETLTADEIEEVLYYDNSQPPDTPAAQYSSSKEVSKILEMLNGITLQRELNEERIETAPGDYCGYEIHLENGKVYTIWRSGKVLIYEGKQYEYTGIITRQLHIDEVVISAKGSIGYPADGKIELDLHAFDEGNTIIVDAPVLKQMDDDRWKVVTPSNTLSQTRVSIANALPYIDLKKDYPQITTGDFKITYDVCLPSGEQVFVTAQFTIFEEE